MAGMHDQPQGAAFDIVLLLHVACVLAGLATVAAAAATASRLRRLLLAGSPIPDAVARYFRPGVNWAGRSMYGIPVFGFILLAMSQGAYALSDGWVAAGLAVFVAVAFVAEGILWPAERRLQVSLVPAAGADSGAAGEARGGADGAPEAVLRDARVMVGSATGALVLLVAATVIMVAQP